jgi:hypothetical protein
MLLPSSCRENYIKAGRFGPGHVKLKLRLLSRRTREVSILENPEMEFLQYLLSRFVDMNDIDVERASLKELMDKLSEELTPIGGG